MAKNELIDNLKQLAHAWEHAGELKPELKDCLDTCVIQLLNVIAETQKRKA